VTVKLEATFFTVQMSSTCKLFLQAMMPILKIQLHVCKALSKYQS